MHQTISIFIKEFKDYFISPIAYIVIAIFLMVTGWLFFSGFFLHNQANMRHFFTLLPWILPFIIPAITMRLFSEEMNIGSYEILLTMPVTSLDVVAGKFLAALAFVAVMLAPTLAYPVSISFAGQLDWGPVAGGYIGAVLLGAAFSAIGLLASSLTRNQIIAFIIGMVICFILTLLDKMLFFFPKAIVQVISYLSTDPHFQNIAKGIIDSRDIIYFLSIIFICLYCSYVVMEEKK